MCTQRPVHLYYIIGSRGLRSLGFYLFPLLALGILEAEVPAYRIEATRSGWSEGLKEGGAGDPGRVMGARRGVAVWIAFS